MATTTSASLSVGLKFNVTDVVETLMASKRGPLSRIESDIKKSNLAISAIGVFRAKLSALRDAALALQDPAAFRVLASSDATVATATAAAGAESGVHSLAVKSVARAETWEISGFTAASLLDAESLIIDASVLSITDGTQTVTGTSGNTLGHLLGQINDSGIPFTAELINKGPVAGGGNLYSLMIRANSLGSANNLTVGGDVSWNGSTLTPSETQSGQNAVFSVDGVEYTRTSNVVDDVVTGLAISLAGKADPTVGYKSGTATTSITVGASSTSTIRTAFQKFMQAYNDLRGFYDAASTTGSASSSEYADYQGSLVGNLAARTVMEQIRGRYFSGNVQGDGVTEVSFMSMGITFSGNLMAFQESAWDAAITAGLADKVASGLTLGQSGADTSKSLVGVLGDAISSNSSVIDSFILSEKYTRLPSLETQKGRAEQSLELLKAMYSRQYSNLNAQLSKLDSMSQSITAMIAGLKGSSN